MQTTEQVFWEKLHTYTIVDAINDKNVLPFKVEYYSTIKEAEDIEDTKIPAIKKEEALMEPKRISEITKYILDHFDEAVEKGYGKLDSKEFVGEDIDSEKEMVVLFLNHFGRYYH